MKKDEGRRVRWRLLAAIGCLNRDEARELRDALEAVYRREVVNGAPRDIGLSADSLALNLFLGGLDAQANLGPVRRAKVVELKPCGPARGAKR